jgi:hypothetical protein
VGKMRKVDKIASKQMKGWMPKNKRNFELVNVWYKIKVQRK